MNYGPELKISSTIFFPKNFLPSRMQSVTQLPIVLEWVNISCFICLKFSSLLSLHVFFLPLVLSLHFTPMKFNWENLCPVIWIWCKQEFRKFVYVFTFHLNSITRPCRRIHLLWSLTLTTIISNPANYISYKEF